MLDCLDDLESDFSVFHRVDDMYSLDAPRFFRLANRIVAYQGVLRLRVEAEARERQEAPEDITSDAVTSDPDLAGLVDYG